MKPMTHRFNRTVECKRTNKSGSVVVIDTLAPRK